MLEWAIFAAVLCLCTYFAYKWYKRNSTEMRLIIVIVIGFFAAFFLYLTAYYYLEGEALSKFYNNGAGVVLITNTTGLTNDLNLSYGTTCEASDNSSNCTVTMDEIAATEWYVPSATTGQYIQYQFNETRNLYKIGIRSSSHANARPASVTITAGLTDAKYQTFGLQNVSTKQFFYLDTPIETNGFNVLINTGYGNDTGLKEVDAFALPSTISLHANDMAVREYFGTLGAMGVPLQILSPLLPIVVLLAVFLTLYFAVEEWLFSSKKR